MVLNLLLHYHTLNYLGALAKEYGGFRNRQAIDMFVKFAKVCFERYQHKVNIG